MYYLSFIKPPKYIYSNHKFFLPNECHMERIFDEDVLIIMMNGILRFSEDDIPIELQAGEYYIQRSGLKQDGPIVSDQPNYYYFHFKGTFTEDEGLPIRGKFNLENIKSLIDNIHQLGFNASSLEYNMYFYTLLYTLLQGQKKNNDATILRSYLIDNYQNSIKLQTLANLIKCSINQVNNIFKKEYGTTAIDYLINYRLEKSMELIVTTERPIMEISQFVGFSNYPVFYQLFEKKFNVSPKECRINKEKYRLKYTHLK